jgi:glycosyltransferase involved in cell wall biosynthesis
MRVLYSFPHPLGSPGIGTTALAQVDSLAAAGVEVTVMCTSVERAPAAGVGVVTTMVVAGRRVPHRVLGVERTWAYHDRRVARLLERNPGRWDVLHAWPLSAVAGLAAARRVGALAVREVPNTHTQHAYETVAALHSELGVPQPPGQSHTPDAERLRRETAEYDAADVILVPSPFALETFRSRAVPDAKLVLHRYGCDLDRFTPAAEPPADPFTAVFVGRCEPRKGLHLALRAWRDSGLADRGRLVVCGDFVPGYAEHVTPLMRHPSVEHRGFVPDTAALMRSAHVLLLPSYEEGSALVTYEAQAAGCVPLVSEAAGALLGEDQANLVHAVGDVATLTRQLTDIAGDRGSYLRMREAGLARREDLSWARVGPELAAIYARGLAARAPGHERGTGRAPDGSSGARPVR